MTNIFPDTLQQLFNNSIEKYKNRPYLSFVSGEPLSYADCGEKAKEIQQMLSNLGVSYGDKVAILAHNMPNWGIAYFAITTMGAVAVPLLPDFSPTEIENILNHSETKVVFVSQRLKEKLDITKHPHIVATVGMDDLSLEYGNINTNIPYQAPTINPNDLAVLIYTSGTTGQSKGVMLSHKNLCAQLEQCYESQNVDTNDIFFSILPLSHTYENSCGLILSTYGGSSTCYLEKPATASVLLPALEKIRPTIMLTVPLIIEKIYRDKVLKQIKANKVSKFLYKIAFTRKLIHKKAGSKLYDALGGKLIFFGIGGAKLDPVVERFLYESKKIPYAIGYGLTETAPLVAAATGKNVKVQSCGFPVKNLEMKINNPNPITKVGEIMVRGNNIMQGYYKNEELTRDVLSEDGWFSTGDLGFLTKTGRLFIRGRLKNLILSASGENIYPEEIESVINNFRYVLESMVVQRKGKLMAMVRFNYEELEKEYSRLKENISTIIESLSEELKEYVNTRVSSFSRIAVVVPLNDEFEKTASLKIKRYLYADQ